MKKHDFHYIKIFFLASVLSFLGIFSFAQNGAIKGTIKDKKTGEYIIGANVVIQGTIQGASSDFNGNYIISNVKPGVYNIVITYISYQTLIIEKIKITSGTESVVNAELSEQVVSMSTVTVTSRKKMDTEYAILNTQKTSSILVTGISNQQIAKTLDRDASEVIKRVPGITIIDGRFVLVRGLNERYNSVWLNNAPTPSSESDVKAFSFDAIPSSLLENLLIYKTSAPELPGEATGASIQLYTKNAPEKNSISLSYNISYRENTTFKDFYKISGSKNDVLALGAKDRSFPLDFPESNEFIKLSNSFDPIAQWKITRLGRSFNKKWLPEAISAIPDQRFSFVSTRVFKLKNNRSINNITALNYSNTFRSDSIYRADFQNYDTLKDKSVFNYIFHDNRYSHHVKIGILHNWSFVVNNNNRIEFRNLLNQIGDNKTTIRNGRDNYGGQTIRAYEFKYSERTTFSSQLGGEHKFLNENMILNWTIGYAYADKIEPDVKRLTSTLNEEDPSDPNYGKYGYQLTTAATPELSGRLFFNLKENIYMAGSNLSYKISMQGIKPELKFGVYVESKNRQFGARNLGYRISKSSQFNFNLLYLPADSFFQDTNINNTTGFKLDEKTNASDSYKSASDMFAFYLGVKIPFSALWNLYAGVRAELSRQSLTSFQTDNPAIPVNIENDTFNIFPSINLTYNTNEKSLLRFAYGISINRPEFREIAPFRYFDFEIKAAVIGQPKLKNAYIHNFDLRYEVYQRNTETVTIGIFYKHFINPIEFRTIPEGSGLAYTFLNATAANSIGSELDIRKSFTKLESKENFLKYLKNFSLVMNASIIKSQIVFPQGSLEKDRPMQGQSPFIINSGIYYKNDSIGLAINLLYNIIGKRIIYVSDPYSGNPDVYEMPRNGIDLIISKQFGKHFSVKLGLQDILNQPIEYSQTISYNKDSDSDGIGDGSVFREEIRYSHLPGRYFSVGINYSF